ncbi:MAG: S-methyl-5-thioribose-1-phosphate isomerase [Saccharofermentanales bacterium]|jgi:methylthioribose-1-phosphate isomerase
MKQDIKDFDTVGLDDQNDALLIIDQTQLPGNKEILALTKIEDIWQAIYLLKVRGAPAIGVAAAIGIYIVAKRIETDSYAEFLAGFNKAKEYLASSRPTAVNLFWALERMEKIVLNNPDTEIEQIKKLLREEALLIREEDIKVCKSIGEYGLSLIKDGDGILTHCNAGSLATVKYGTALAPIYVGLEQGMTFKVYADETRPLLQGARLTAYELVEHGVDTTVICDNMAAQVMKNGWIDAIFVGCDRVAANGDAANKIGTSAVAILAKHYGIPFYVCAPTSTIDMKLKHGDDIPIEERRGEEIAEMWYKQRMIHQNAKTYNPAFDVTDHELITAIITEYGIIRAPYAENLKELFDHIV